MRSLYEVDESVVLTAGRNDARLGSGCLVDCCQFKQRAFFSTMNCHVATYADTPAMHWVQCVPCFQTSWLHLCLLLLADSALILNPTCAAAQLSDFILLHMCILMPSRLVPPSINCTVNLHCGTEEMKFSSSMWKKASLSSLLAALVRCNHV